MNERWEGFTAEENAACAAGEHDAWVESTVVCPHCQGDPGYQQWWPGDIMERDPGGYGPCHVCLGDGRVTPERAGEYLEEVRWGEEIAAENYWYEEIMRYEEADA